RADAGWRRSDFPAWHRGRGSRRETAQDPQQASRARQRGRRVSRSAVRAAAAALCALSLSGCVDSDRPILTDSQPLFGNEVRLQFYTLRKGFVDEPEQASFKWQGERYIHTGGGLTRITPAY